MRGAPNDTFYSCYCKRAGLHFS